jgi:hypothetical protein
MSGHENHIYLYNYKNPEDTRFAIFICGLIQGTSGEAVGYLNRLIHFPKAYLGVVINAVHGKPDVWNGSHHVLLTKKKGVFEIFAYLNDFNHKHPNIGLYPTKYPTEQILSTFNKKKR